MKSREERESPEETTTGCSGVLTATGYRRIRRRIIRLVFVRFGFTEPSSRSSRRSFRSASRRPETSPRVRDDTHTRFFFARLVRFFVSHFFICFVWFRVVYNKVSIRIERERERVFSRPTRARGGRTRERGRRGRGRGRGRGRASFNASARERFRVVVVVSNDGFGFGFGFVTPCVTPCVLSTDGRRN